MKKLHWMVERETRDRYVLDQVPDEPLHSFREYKRLDDFKPAAWWRDWTYEWVGWDESFQKMFRPEFAALAAAKPNDPIPISVQAKHFAKSYARKHGLKTLGGPGVVFWADFPRVAPCWLVITKTQAYKMVTEKQFGVQHG